MKHKKVAPLVRQLVEVLIMKYCNCLTSGETISWSNSVTSGDTILSIGRAKDNAT
jgi:hypothetical protein